MLSLAFTATANRSTGTDLAVGVWDLEQRKAHVLAGHAAAVTGVAAMPGGGRPETPVAGDLGVGSLER
jgi:hypothetical protein